MKTTTEDIHRLRSEVHRHLHSDLVPFWCTRAKDEHDGGYLTNFDERGNALPTPEKYLNSQCRLIWWFSRLCGKGIAAPECSSLARHGVDFLVTHFWDPVRGGFFWKTRSDGTCPDEGKIVYGQSFAIYALSEYTRATGDPRGLDYAGRVFDLLQIHAGDTAHGGYYENLKVDWTPEEAGFAGGDRKGLDTHMHLMESFTVLYQASGKAIHRRKLLQVLDLIVTRMVDPVTGCGLNQFDSAFRSIPAIAVKRTWNAERLGEQPADPTETTSYGHNVELSWLMRRALAVAGEEVHPFLPIMQRLLDHAVKHGIDPEHGGLFRDGLRHGGPLVLEKEFWQHAEALVGFLDGFEQFGDARYLDAFANIWGFVHRHFVIKGVGEWRTLLDRRGVAIDPNIGNPWKVAYHTGRALVECSERLEPLGL